MQDSARRRWIVGYSIGWPRPHMFVHVKIESTEKMKMVLKDVLSKEKRKFLKRRPVVVLFCQSFETTEIEQSSATMISRCYR